MLKLVNKDEQKIRSSTKVIRKKKDKESRNKEIDNMINASKIVRINTLTEQL